MAWIFIDGMKKLPPAIPAVTELVVILVVFLTSDGVFRLRI